MFARTEQIADAENQVLGFERLDDILLSPGGQGFADRLLILLDAVDDDRDEIGAGILHPYFSQKYHLIFSNIQIKKFIKNHIFVPYLSRDALIFRKA